MNLELFSFLPDNLFWIPPILIIIYHVFNFTIASKTQKLLENKTLKTIRIIFKELSRFIVIILMVSFLPAFSFDKNNLFFNISMSLATILFTINFIFFYESSKAKFLIKNRLFKLIIKENVIRPITFTLNKIIVLIMFVNAYTESYYNIKETYHLQSKTIFALILELQKKDNTTILFASISALIIYLVFWAYLFPVFMYKYKKVNIVFFDIYLINGDILSNLKLDEVLKDSYVFSSIQNNKNEIDDRHIISKDKILYLKTHANFNNSIL